MGNSLPPARNIQINRVYAAPARDEGARALVDQLWPRGIKKKNVTLDRWEKVVAPNTALRKWYGHDPLGSDEFRKRYAVNAHSSVLVAPVTRARERPTDARPFSAR